MEPLSKVVETTGLEEPTVVSSPDLGEAGTIFPQNNDVTASPQPDGISSQPLKQVKKKISGLLKKNVKHQKYDWREGDPYEPCAGCCYTPYEAYWQKHYKSEHKLSYVCQDTACWSLGSKVVLKDRPQDPNNLEVDNMKFLKKKTTIPLPAVVHDWDEPNGRYHLLQEKIDGVALEKVWEDLSDDGHDRIAKQAAEYLVELRDLVSDKMQNVRGEPCRNNGPVPKRTELLGPSASDDDVWSTICPALKDVDEALRGKLRAKTHPVKPFTFTHGDLTLVNIMVKDGNFAGLIDFEYSAYFPSWWEYARNAIGFSEDDRAWKDLLCKHMLSHNSTNEAGYRWWRACNALAKIPNGDTARERLRELLDEKSSEAAH